MSQGLGMVIAIIKSLCHNLAKPACCEDKTLKDGLNLYFISNHKNHPPARTDQISVRTQLSITNR